MKEFRPKMFKGFRFLLLEWKLNYVKPGKLSDYKSLAQKLDDERNLFAGIVEVQHQGLEQTAARAYRKIWLHVFNQKKPLPPVTCKAEENSYNGQTAWYSSDMNRAKESAIAELRWSIIREPPTSTTTL